MVLQAWNHRIQSVGNRLGSFVERNVVFVQRVLSKRESEHARLAQVSYADRAKTGNTNTPAVEVFITVRECLGF